MNITIILPLDIRILSFGYRRRGYHLRDESRLRGVNLFRGLMRYVKPAKWQRYMSDLVSRVMKAASSQLLHQEAIQVDQEMEKLVAEMELPVWSKN